MRLRTEQYKKQAREHARAQRIAHPEIHRQRVKASRDKALAEDSFYHKKKDLARFYGVTFDWYLSALAEQNHACAVCKRPEDQNTTRQGKPLSLSVDHCHDTGKVRGLLCNNCNRAIGLLGDSIETLKAAQAYLAKSLVGLT